MSAISYSIYLVCLAFAPLAFGTVEKWSTTTLEVLTALGLLAYGIAAFCRKSEVVQCVGLRPLVMLLGFVVIQLIPLPIAVLKFVAPATYAMYLPVAEVSSSPLWGTLSLVPQSTVIELLRYTTYVGVYFLTVQLLANNPGRLKFTLRFIVFLGAFVAFVGIIQEVSFPHKIFGFRAAPHGANPFGPWVNANQFAGFMEILFPLALGLFLFYRPIIRSDESLKEKFVSVVTMPGIHLYLYIGLSALIMFVAVFYSLCRGGILSIVFASGLFAFFHHRRFPRDGQRIIIMFCVAALGAVSWLGWDIVLSEFGTGITAQGTFQDGRITLWRDTVQIIKDYPLLGAGFGSFVALYPQYKTIADNLVYDHAHNDYLELLSDGGIVAFILVAWFLVTLLRHLLRMVNVRRDHFAIFIGIGTLCSLAAILAHAGTDFNLHNMAVGYYAFVLCGIGVAAVNCRFSYTAPGTLLLKYKARGNKALLAAVTSSALLILVGNSLYWGGLSSYREVAEVYLTHNLAPEYLQKIQRQIERAKQLFCWEGLYSYRLGSVLWFSGEREQAKDNFLEAARINPLEGIYLQKLGLLQEDDTRAEQLIAEGFRRALYKSDLILGYVEWLLAHDARTEAVELLHGRIIDDPRVLNKLIPILQGYGFSLDEISRILPADARAWLAFGRYCEQQQQLAEAAVFFKGATDIVLYGPFETFDSDALLQLIRYYNSHEDKLLALQLIRFGIDKNPDYAAFHILLGQYYETEGITYRAKEEFEKALILDPSNRQVLQKLRRLGGGDSY